MLAACAARERKKGWTAAWGAPLAPMIILGPASPYVLDHPQPYVKKGSEVRQVRKVRQHEVLALTAIT